jgi:hypothetical protein
MIINSAYAETTVAAALTAVLPIDGTLPLATEGTQVVAVTITPRLSTSRLRVIAKVVGQVSGGSFTTHVGSALFAGTTPIDFTSTHLTTSGALFAHVLLSEFSSSSTVPIMLSVRSGQAGGGQTLNINTPTANGFKCSISVEEIAP